MANFSLSARAAKDVTVIAPKGYINDLGAVSLEQTSEQVLNEGTRKLIVNFAAVQHINTIGVSILTDLVQKTIEHNSELCFTNMKKIHRDIFDIVGLIKHVRVFKDEEDALGFLNGRESDDR